MEEIVMRFSNYSAFSEIAQKAYKEFQVAEKEYDLIMAAPPKTEEEEVSQMYESMPSQSKIHEQGFITIVFAALALEGYIYDYGARKLSDGFMKKYMEKIDVITKWILIPQLATGNAFPKEKQGFEYLKKLVKNRNSIVHSKSTGVKASDLDTKREELWEGFRAFRQDVHDSINTFEKLAEDFKECDPHENLLAELSIHRDNDK